jgi:hypothetical protein
MPRKKKTNIIEITENANADMMLNTGKEKQTNKKATKTTKAVKPKAAKAKTSKSDTVESSTLEVKKTSKASVKKETKTTKTTKTKDLVKPKTKRPSKRITPILLDSKNVQDYDILTYDVISQRESFVRMSELPYELRFKGIKIYDSKNKGVVVFEEDHVMVNGRKYVYSALRILNK